MDSEKQRAIDSGSSMLYAAETPCRWDPMLILHPCRFSTMLVLHLMSTHACGGSGVPSPPLWARHATWPEPWSQIPSRYTKMNHGLVVSKIVSAHQHEPWLVKNYSLTWTMGRWCAKTAEPIEMPFGQQTSGVIPRYDSFTNNADVNHGMMVVFKGRNRELCKNSWTDRDTIWPAVSCGFIPDMIDLLTSNDINHELLVIKELFTDLNHGLVVNVTLHWHEPWASGHGPAITDHHATLTWTGWWWTKNYDYV